MLKENLANVEKNIEQACKNAGRSRDEVRWSSFHQISAGI